MNKFTVEWFKQLNMEYDTYKKPYYHEIWNNWSIISIKPIPDWSSLTSVLIQVSKYFPKIKKTRSCFLEIPKFILEDNSFNIELFLIKQLKSDENKIDKKVTVIIKGNNNEIAN